MMKSFGCRIFKKEIKKLKYSWVGFLLSQSRQVGRQVYFATNKFFIIKMKIKFANIVIAGITQKDFKMEKEKKASFQLPSYKKSIYFNQCGAFHMFINNIKEKKQKIKIEK